MNRKIEFGVSLRTWSALWSGEPWSYHILELEVENELREKVARLIHEFMKEWHGVKPEQVVFSLETFLKWEYLMKNVATVPCFDNGNTYDGIPITYADIETPITLTPPRQLLPVMVFKKKYPDVEA